MNKFLKALSVSAVAMLTISFQTSAQNVEEGVKHLDAEQYIAAGKIFRQLAQATPTAENNFYLGYYYLRLPEPRLDSAKMAFEKGLTLDPKKPDPLCRVGLGAVKLGMKDRTGAKADFDAITKDTKSKNPDVLYRIGEAYTLFDNANDPAEAVRNIDLALVKKKDNPEYFIVTGDAYMIKNDGGPAMTNYETAEKLGKDLGKIYSRMGQVWVQGKNYEKAYKYYQDAIKADPNFAPTYRQLGNLYVTYQKYPQAAEMFRKYLELADTDDMAKLRYVKLAFTAKDYTNAMRVLDEIKGRINDPIKYRLEGMSDFEMGKPELAIPVITNFINSAGNQKDKDGNDRVIGQDYGFRGRSYAALKEPDKDKKKINDSLAVIDMQKAISLNDTTFNYYPEIGKIYTANKNYKKAVETYKAKIAANKKEDMGDLTLLGQALYNYGRSTKDTNTLVESETVWAKAADYYKEKYPIAYYFAGNSRRFIDGDVPTGKAIPALENYVKYASVDKEKNKRFLIDAYNYLGQVTLFLSKDTVKASDYYKKTLELDPTNAIATDALNKINGVVPPATTTPPNNTPNNGQPQPQPKN